MELISVILAGVAAFAAGAAWYIALGSAWKDASGVPLDTDGQPVNANDPKTYITGLVCAVIVAGMMRHIFVLGNIDTIGEGAVSGLGLGLFVAAPWLITNYSFAARPVRLMMIDAGYATLGCTVIGTVLTLF